MHGISGAYAAPVPCTRGFHPLDTGLRSGNIIAQSFFRMLRTMSGRTERSAGIMKTKKCRKRKFSFFLSRHLFVFPDAGHPAGGRYAAVPAERSTVLEVHGASPARCMNMGKENSGEWGPGMCPRRGEEAAPLASPVLRWLVIQAC